MSILPGITGESYSAGLDFVEANNIPSNVGHHEITLEPMHEVSLEIDTNELVKLTIQSGNCEIYGTELANHTEYRFKGPIKLPVFSFKGAKLVIDGDLIEGENMKIVEETMMNTVVNIALSLEKQATLAHQMNDSLGISRITGPKVMIVGEAKSGKSWLARTLASYALKFDRQVMLINTDPQRPQFVCPGAMTATPISDIFNVENVNYGETEATGSNFYHPKQPLVKSFGLDDARSNLELYKTILSRLSDVVYERFSKDSVVANSGLILDTASNVPDEILDYIMDKFKINIVIQLGDKSWQCQNQDIKCYKIPKSVNSIEESDQYIRQIHARCIREYFYGIDRLSLSPYTLTCNYGDFKVYKPVNRVRDVSETTGEPIEVTENWRGSPYFIPVEVDSSHINNAIFTIPRPQDPYSCAGFVCVISCDDEKKKCRILLPSPSSSLPTNEFVLTDFRYYE